MGYSEKLMTPHHSKVSRTLVLSALFIALVVAVGYAFIYIPNIELVTATIFVAGYLLGPRRGIVVGATAEFIFGLIHPLGASAPPLLIAQVFSMAVVGFVGGLVGRRRRMPVNAPLRILIFAGLGFFLTLVFDVLTTLSFAVFISGLSAAKIIATFTLGSFFYVTHLVANTVIFASVVPAIVIGLGSHLENSSSSVKSSG